MRQTSSLTQKCMRLPIDITEGECSSGASSGRDCNSIRVVSKISAADLVPADSGTPMSTENKPVVVLSSLENAPAS